jgi:hypothetical protein
MGLSGRRIGVLAGAGVMVGGTTVATLNGDIPGYASLESGRPSMTVPGSWYGYASKLPVITTEPGWRRLPGRCLHGREQGFRGDASHLGGVAVQSRDSRA